MDEKGQNKLFVFIKGRIGTYKFALLVIAAGLVLLLMPQNEKKAEEGTAVSAEVSFSVEQMEEKLEGVLSRIAGAGEVTVMLTQETGGDRIYATDRSMSNDEREETLVVISGQDGGENAVIETQKAPMFRGALVVCQGGGDPAVKLQITQAVSDLTGLGTDRITVCEGN